MDNRPVLVRIVAALQSAGIRGVPFNSITLVLGTSANERLTKELETLAALTESFPINTYQTFVGLPKTSRTDVDPNAVVITCSPIHA